jgi:hypothetical protein
VITCGSLDAYARRGHQLLARCAVATGNPEPGAADFVCWLADLRPTLRTNTWHVYRRAACHILEGHPDNDAAAAIAALRALGAPTGPKPPRRTSAMRAKAVAPADLISLLDGIGRSRSIHRYALGDWLIAGIATGLRPCEWSGTTLNGRVLTVANAKFSDGWRGLGPSRNLDLSTLLPYDFDAVVCTVERAARWVADGDYGEHQQACSDLLRAVNLRLWPSRLRRITLYSPRHQYAANGKSGDPAELAASMGHLAERSAFRSYGKSRDGWGSKAPPRPGVSADVVAQVRRSGLSARPLVPSSA